MFADDNGASLETVHKQTFVPSLQYCSSTFLPEACDETSGCSVAGDCIRFDPDPRSPKNLGRVGRTSEFCGHGSRGACRTREHNHITALYDPGDHHTGARCAGICVERYGLCCGLDRTKTSKLSLAV